ncbi:MAG: CoA protein activase [Clostridia bacterium]|nr:CoA protein activase [Clostridia bacterium]
MKITIPHLGNLYVFVKVLFDCLAVEYILPPPCTKRTLEIGTKYSPEMACLPLKINLGNFIESIELGADTIIITGAGGPCRYGYYCKMHEEMLKDLGYSNVKLIAIDPYAGLPALLKSIKTIFGTVDFINIAVSGVRAYRVMAEVDRLDKLCYYIRPRELVKGSANAVMRLLRDKIYSARNIGEVKKIVKETRAALLNIEVDTTLNPLKIGLMGEIYTIIEPFTNFNMEELLGDLGIEVDKTLTISKWIKEHLVKLHNHKEKAEYDKACEPYLKTPIGGHARESIGHSALYAKRGGDGIMQIYPLTCMPEIVASSILPALSRDYDIPLLTVVIDEITGDAGYKTRIEAFKDLLLKKREAKNNDGLLCRN